MIVVIAFQFDIDGRFIFADQVKEGEDAADSSIAETEESMVDRSKQLEEKPEMTAVSQSSVGRDTDDGEDTGASDTYQPAPMIPEGTAESSGTDQSFTVPQQPQNLEEKGKITHISIRISIR